VAEHWPQGVRAKFVPWMDPFLKRFGKKAPAAAAIERRVPDGMRVYCVGDIHGRDDLLRQMAEHIEALLPRTSSAISRKAQGFDNYW